VIILGKFFFLFSDYQINNEKKLLALIISKNLLFIKAEYFSITTEVILCMLYSVFSRKKSPLFSLMRAAAPVIVSPFKLAGWEKKI
jgi:hypothetical protein